MKNTSIKIILTALICALLPIGAPLTAQVKRSYKTKPHESTPEGKRHKDQVSNTHKITVGMDEVQNDSTEMLLNLFYVDQFRHFRDPRAPYFMFLSKAGNVALGVGGQVNVRGWYDWAGSIPSMDFVTYDIPIPNDPANSRNLSASAAYTSLFFTLLGSNAQLGEYMAYFQADFNGYNHRGFRIKKAYVSLGDWTAGYATTTFEDTKAEPSTVDGEGPNGVNSRTNVLLRYMHTFKDKWTVAGSLEFPSQSLNADGTNTKAANPYLPDIAAFGQFEWNNGASHIRLSGLLRTLTYRDLIRQRNYNITGWGLQLSTIIKACNPLNFIGIFSVGRGHASYTTDLGNGSFDLIQVEDDPGKLYAPVAGGIVVGAQYYFRHNIFANLAFSEQIYYPKTSPRNDQYKYGLYAVGNVFWDITPRFEVGLEYLHGKRANFNGMSGSANRLMMMMMMSF